MDDDPQLALRRPVSLVARPPQAEEPATPRLAVMPPIQQPQQSQPGPQPLQSPSVAQPRTPNVVELNQDKAADDSITSNQENVNRLVRSVAALRSAFVDRPVYEPLNEGSLR